MRRIVTALALVLVLSLAACGSDQEADGIATAGGGGATATPADAQAWTRCMEAEGVTLTVTEEGNPVVDKEKTPIEKVEKATAKCRSLAPPATEAETPPLTPEQLTALRAHAACMREKGITEYPDPDPKLGRSNADDVIIARGKGDALLVAAMKACDPLLGGQGGGTVGG